ncbi:MAG: enoyl-CoA hydratase/isomerase family protein [Alphaproteobacteria bacterium]|nr:enoyl-CoA hydratase/isomerase family protein [Alphaproteobacteria bacterium]
MTGDNPVLNPGYQYKAVKVAMRGPVFEITLNRPERLNTFNAEMQRDFTALQLEIERNPEIRCVAIFAAGDRAFGAGADLSWFEHDWTASRFRTEYRWIHDFFDVLERVEVPVIAAVFGTCACGGLELAMAADFRIAADDTRFGFTEGNINLVPGSGGCSRLARMIGPGWAKELVLAGEFIDAARALHIGLVTRVVAKDKLADEARTLADKLVKKAPQALGAAKAVINAAHTMDPTTGRILERMAQSALIVSQDHKEGVKAFREKRPPQYKGR